MTQRSDAGAARSAAPRPRVKHSITEPLRSLMISILTMLYVFIFQSERNEYDFMHAKGITTKSAPFGNLDTPMITMKLVGGEYKPCIESSPR